VRFALCAALCATGVAAAGLQSSGVVLVRHLLFRASFDACI
jgi:hypothetical protein